MLLDLYTQTGEKKGTVEVSDKVFGIKPNSHLIHLALVRQLSNRRHPVAHTKTKGEVRGGGKKPYAQKHTGWARQGSTRNPHFKGGGVAFGPNNTRNYELRMPKKARRKALFSALSAKAKEGNVFVMEDYQTEKVKTKLFSTTLKKLPAGKSSLFVLPKRNEVFEKSSRNIPHVKSLLVSYLNIADLLKYEKVVFLKESLPQIEEVFNPQNRMKS